MKRARECVSMGELTSIMTKKNWQNNPETIMDFMLKKIKLTGKVIKYLSIMSEKRVLYDEMIIISAEIKEIEEMRTEVKAMSAFKRWRTNAAKNLKRVENESIDLQRVCQYFLYTYMQSGGRRDDLLPKFKNYVFQKL
ncbi:MAG: hypothetical protein IJW72_05655 [Alphaproteobacteria bacterium]|nr:hypothetical protein [Alphaproteobacteria bacterium]MBQ7285719.1 hypothetical protein [Alphaproteobacteria bacterium]